MTDKPRMAVLVTPDNLSFDFALFWSHLLEVERQRLRDKAAWEHMTLAYVALEWFGDLMAKVGQRALAAGEVKS